MLNYRQFVLKTQQRIQLRRIPVAAMLWAILSLAASSSMGQAADQLTVEGAISMALRKNFDIRIGEIEVQQAEQGIAVGGEAFETTVSVTGESFRSNGSDSFIAGEGNQQQLSLNKRFSTGTNVGVSVSSIELDDLTGNSRSTMSGVAVTQHLLKGRSFASNRAPIRIATKRLGISQEALRQRVIDTISDTQYAFFDVLLASANLRVAEESLALAEQLLSENQRRKELGSIASSELLQAKAEVAARRERMHQAEGSLVWARNRLKKMTSDSVGELLNWDFEVVAPADPIYENFVVEEAYTYAMEERPDYRQAVLNLDISEIEELRNRNAKLPSVDLYAQMSFRGFGDSFGNSFDESLQDGYPDYSAGVRLSLSLPNAAANARSLISRLENNRLNLSLKQLEQAILLDLDSSIAQIEANWKRLESAKNSHVLAKQSLDAEQKRYQRGASSTFVLIRLQTDLANAQIRELVASNDYRKSVVELERQTASVLEAYNIDM